MKVYAYNRRAKYDYEVKETLVAGLVLSGAEAKSIKNGSVSLTGSYVKISPKEASLINCHIGPYKYASQKNYEPTQTRKLLLEKKEINRLLGKEKGLVIVPLDIFQGKRGLVKIKIGLGRARKKTDKREYIKKREVDREIREYKESN